MSHTRFAQLFVVVICGLILSLSVSCRKDLDFENSITPLRFSQDTIFLDTIFTQSNSETYLLKVYNPSDDDISLSEVYLNQRDNSAFRINVDGLSGFEFSEIPVRANDSLMIFVEIAVDSANQNFIEEDELVFSDSNQEVKFLAMVEEAKYYYPTANDDFVHLTEDTWWDDSTSHVIYGTMKVDEGKTLNISEGTKVYFHQNSGLEIMEGGTLNLNGSLQAPIIIRGDRHDPRYDSLPKQWNEIKISHANLNSNHVIIKGGVNGLNVDHSSATITNTQIYNMSYSGIFAKNANIEGSNVAISAAGGASLNIEKGGNYNFVYSTFANVWETTPANVNGPKVPAYLSNYTTIVNEDESETDEYANFNGSFANCIFYGDFSNGVLFSVSDQAYFEYEFDSCLFKNEDLNRANFNNDTNIIQPSFGNPFFESILLSQQDLRIRSDSESEALNNANPIYNAIAPLDITGQPRSSTTPTIGAYENQ